MKEQQEMHRRYHEAFPTVITVEDAMRQALKIKDECDTWRWIAEGLAQYGSCDVDDTGAKCHKCVIKWNGVMKRYKEAGGIDG